MYKLDEYVSKSRDIEIDTMDTIDIADLMNVQLESYDGVNDKVIGLEVIFITYQVQLKRSLNEENIIISIKRLFIRSWKDPGIYVTHRCLNKLSQFGSNHGYIH